MLAFHSVKSRLFAIALVFAFGCSGGEGDDEPPEPDAAADAVPPPKDAAVDGPHDGAAVLPDGSVPADASADAAVDVGVADGGAEPDAGVDSGVDAGGEPDAGTDAGSGAPDSGMPDAGAPDASTTPDAAVADTGVDAGAPTFEEVLARFRLICRDECVAVESCGGGSAEECFPGCDNDIGLFRDDVEGGLSEETVIGCVEARIVKHECIVTAGDVSCDRLRDHFLRPNPDDFECRDEEIAVGVACADT